MNTKTNEKYYRYLFQLQESGATNMFGAAPYLISKFGLERNEAKEVLLSWMDGYQDIAKELNIEV